VISRKPLTERILSNSKQYHICCMCGDVLKSSIKVFTRSATWCVQCWSDEEAMRRAVMKRMKDVNEIEPPLGYKFQTKAFVDMAYNFTPIFNEWEH
jgi:hypothetical protein